MIDSSPAFEHTCLVCKRKWVSSETVPVCKNCEAIEFTIDSLKKVGLEIDSWSLLEDGQVELVTPLGIVFLEVRNKSSYLIRAQDSTGWQKSDHRLMKWEVEKLVSRLSKLSDEERKHQVIRKRPSICMAYA